jgi:hypothetical protein
LITLNEGNSGIACVRFGDGQSISFLGFIVITIPIGKIVFHILDASIPFLFSLKDMDRLKVYLNNVINEIIFTNGKRRAPVIRKWGHPWFFTSKLESALYFTDVKLKRLH